MYQSSRYKCLGRYIALAISSSTRYTQKGHSGASLVSTGRFGSNYGLCACLISTVANNHGKAPYSMIIATAKNSKNLWLV